MPLGASLAALFPNDIGANVEKIMLIRVSVATAEGIYRCEVPLLGKQILYSE